MIFDFWKNAVQFDITAIEYAGHGRHYVQELMVDFNEIVMDAAEQISSAGKNPSICLFGHSMGALVAFETAHQLRKERIDIHHLFVSGMSAPKVWIQKTVGISDNNVLDTVKLLNGIPSEVLNNSDILNVFLPIIQADYNALDTYRYQHSRPLDCPITVFNGTEDEDMRYGRNEWREETNAACTFYDYPGSHFFIKEQNQDMLRVMGRELQSTYVDNFADVYENICY